MKNRFIVQLLAALPLLVSSSSSSFAADWRTYRGDAQRTGYSADALPEKLIESWKFTPSTAPQPAWHTRERKPHDRDQRLRRQFDMVFQPIVVGGTLYFGSSADDQLYAIDAATGRLKWTYFTDGPIRVAPASWLRGVYVTSDDGFLHCVDGATGELRWKLHGAPQQDQVLGNGRMISRWPCRGGAAIANGIVYFAAGVWPSEKTYVVAAAARTGKVLWRYSNEAADPKNSNDVQFKFVSQGHLAVSNDKLVVPTGRISSYYFNSSNGKFLHGAEDFLAYGDPIVVDEIVFHKSFRYPSTIARESATNAKAAGTGLHMAASRDFIFSTNHRSANIEGQPRPDEPLYAESTGRKGERVKKRTLPAVTLKLGKEIKDVYELICCRNRVIAACGTELVVVDIAGKMQQRFKLDSPAWGLAVADGRLFASTEKGTIYCFSAKAMNLAPSKVVLHKRSPQHDAAAKEIIAKTDIERGLCIDVAADGGELAIALAARAKNLRIYALDDDAERVAKTRARLAKLGLYGSRITVHFCEDLSKQNLKWYADLVVSGASVNSGNVDVDALEPICSPYVGKGCVGKPGSTKVFGGKPLDGAGNWTHMYADAGNTYNSNDETIKGPLRMRWYSDTMIGLPERHGRAQQPAVYDGYMITPGLDGVHVCSVYNGMPYWSQSIPGMMHEVNDWHAGGTGTGGHMCIGDDRVFARAKNKCFVFDLHTGKKLSEYSTPAVAGAKDGQWGYLAYSNGIVFGAVSDPNHEVWGTTDKYKINKLLVESKAVFAIDAKTGETLWVHMPELSIRNNTIAVDGRAIYFIDRVKFRSLTLEAGTVMNRQLRALAAKSGTTLKEEIAKYVKRDPGVLITLDSRTGKERWRSKWDVRGTSLMVSDKYKRVHVGANEAYGVLGDGGDDGRVFDSNTGKLVFNGPRRRTMLNGFEFDGKDIRTGETIRKDRSVVGSFAWRVKGCGMSSGSRYCTMLGNGAMRYVDHSVTPARMQFWAGVKANCWISAIPAGGVVVNGSTGYGCQCNYHTMQATFVLEPSPH